MKLIIIRHAEPDYEIDGLTKKGQREAELLAKRLSEIKPDVFYCSTMGRAKCTIEPTLKALSIFLNSSFHKTQPLCYSCSFVLCLKAGLNPVLSVHGELPRQAQSDECL